MARDGWAGPAKGARSRRIPAGPALAALPCPFRKRPMYAVLHDVLPVFLLILTGWITVQTGALKAETGEALGEFVFKIAVPVLLFRTVAHADVSGGTPLRLWVAYFSGVAVTWTIGHLVGTRLF